MASCEETPLVYYKFADEWDVVVEKFRRQILQATAGSASYDVLPATTQK